MLVPQSADLEAGIRFRVTTVWISEGHFLQWRQVLAIDVNDQ